MAAQQKKFDIVVVGSGPGGGICAYALTRAGLKVALVEAGPRLRAGVDYNSHGPYYEHLESRLRAGRSPEMPVSDFNERNHFTAVGDRPGHGQLRALGGRSLCWAGHALRFGPLDFKQWPISYEQVAPYYSRTERFMNVYGNRDGLWNMPDGEFLRGVPLRCGEQMLRKGVERLKGRGRVMEFVQLRKAMPTEPGTGRTQCHFCGHCMAGCEVDAKYTSANTPIPLAMKTGNLTLLLETKMTAIRMQDSRRVRGIHYVTRAGATGELEAGALVLACSTVETARHLLIGGVANSSGMVGRNLMTHFGTTVTGLFPALHGRDHTDDEGTDYYHGLLTGLYWKDTHKDFRGTYQVQCGSGMQPASLRLKKVPGFGAQLKRDLLEWNATHAAMGMQGSLLPSALRFVELDPERKDADGLPLPRLHHHYEENDLAMANDMIRMSEDIIEAGGGKVLFSPGRASADGLVLDTNHWVGTTKMGTDPKTSVVDAEGRTHDVVNLFIGDSSVFPVYPEKNPTLTNVALAWRMCDRLAERARKGELS